MGNSNEENVSEFMRNDDAQHLVNLLNRLKGSRAVEYVLTELLRKDNKHTLHSVLELIRQGDS